MLAGGSTLKVVLLSFIFNQKDLSQNQYWPKTTKKRMMLTSVSGKFLYCGSTKRSANSMYEQGTDSIISSENWKEIESATVELCWRRPSGLTGGRGSIQIIHMITKLQLAMII